MAPRKKLKGLVAATITPMTPDGKINLSVIRQYVDYLVNEQNVKNIFVNGTTGEGLSLSIQERKLLAEEWMCQGKDKLDHVIIHVGALNLPECQELARHAAAMGADGIAVIAPFFFKPTNKVRVEELLDGIKAQIPTFQGVKFSDTDLLDLAQCIHKNETGEFEFLYGVDEFLTGEFLNFVIKLGFGVAQTKALMTSVSGIPMGPPRLPLVDASSEFVIKAKAKLDSIVWPNGD
ncbi:N-acetylneuraminate lyase [Lonchura striata]|uniref:N-acetylneuraminate lyase n=1 Tax=Lonchura striata TaxID=40157 RepID=A0A218UU02_9PASE|nr:N-acetylneuraminate lyase [Lonchura striata domestica]